LYAGTTMEISIFSFLIVLLVNILRNYCYSISK
jgi:hypothetical protein